MLSLSGAHADAFLLERISDGLIGLGSDHGILYMNEQAKKLLNIAGEEMTSGHTLGDLLDQDSALFMQNKISKASVQHETLHFEMEMKQPSVKWLSIHLYPADTGTTILLRDNTSRKLVESSIENQNKKLMLLSEAANHILSKREPGELLDALFRELSEYLDLDVYFNYMINDSKGCLELMNYQGISREDAQDMHFLDLGEAVCGTVARDRERIIAENIDFSPDPKVSFIKGQGIKAYACHPLISYGKLIGTLSFGSRSRTNFTEDELDLLQTLCNQVAITLDRTLLILELTKKKEEAERASSAKSDFLSMMSHELRTPLNSIIGFAQILSDDCGEPVSFRQSEKVGKILNSSRHLLNLINDLLDLVKIEAGKPILNKESLRVESFIHNTLKMILPQARAKNIRIYDQTQSCSHIHVKADPTRINQILLNLLENAVKYSEAGGKIIISADIEDNKLKISVADSGFGIPEDLHEHIFEPFYRIFNQEKNIEGTGIGLTLVKQLIMQMGGTIGINSEPGSGSCFWFTLPISRESILPIEEYTITESQLIDLCSLSGKVLYIDDNRNDLALLETIFEKQENVRLISSADGKEGVGIAADRFPDLILLDIHMPDFHGLKVVEKLKNDAVTCDIPIIAISADSSRETINRARECGVSDYLTKPIDIKLLLKKIGEYL
ncbi:ATP-binding protein [Cytobacillus firmus]|uniref:histidine kinase n=1 Tax=Cytobacillus firmus DS1 TaxID=1307436 RepID=W7L8F3_CYTFI|nr:ATP-binding protein [Cytobacillus firmus]EWG11542.1 multi-sensor hybrid histidine kinase [Cytobacillus firmus DS1]